VGRVRLVTTATVLPIVILVLAVIGFAVLIATAPAGEGSIRVPLPLVALLALFIPASLAATTMTIIYAVIAVSSPIPGRAKLLWATAVLVAGHFAMPFALYHLVLIPRRNSTSTTPPASGGSIAGLDAGG